MLGVPVLVSKDCTNCNKTIDWRESKQNASHYTLIGTTIALFSQRGLVMIQIFHFGETQILPT